MAIRKEKIIYELNLGGLADQSAWQNAGIALPVYDISAAVTAAKKDPKWVHLGIGNILRIFIGSIGDDLLAAGGMASGITCVDTSQMVGIRFGETIKEYVKKDGDAKKLLGIPLAIAGWLRYLLAVDDDGNPFELSSDPMNDELTKMLKDVRLGNPETYSGQLKPLLANTHIFGSDLYEDGIGELIEEMFVRQLAGKGAVRKTLREYLG